MEQTKATMTQISDEEIDAVLAEAKGDAREAIRMLLHDIVILAAGAGRQVSSGYVRGRAPWLRAS